MNPRGQRFWDFDACKQNIYFSFDLRVLKCDLFVRTLEFV